MIRHDGRTNPHQRRDPFSNMMFGGKPQPPVNERPNFFQPPRPNYPYHGQGLQQQYSQQPQGGYPNQFQGFQAPQQQGHLMQGNPNQPGYPVQGGPPTKGQKGAQFMKHFQKEDGSLDYMKIGNSVQQVYGIYGQVSPLVKQLSPLLSILKK